MKASVQPYYSPKLLAEACSHYQLNGDQAKLLRENSNLVFDCGDQVLRLTHSSVRRIEDMQVELEWLIDLKNRGLPVVHLVPSLTGRFFVQITVGDTYFTATCFQKIYGRKINKDDWTASHFRLLGTLAAQLHKAANDFSYPSKIVYPHWNETADYFHSRHLPEDERRLPALHDQLIDQFANYPKTPENYGLIHYDIHHGNYLLTPKQGLILFDFEMTCKAWFMKDIAALFYYALNYDPTTEALLPHFWQAYEALKPISAQEKEWLPALLLYRDLMVLGYILDVWDHRGQLTAQQRQYTDRLEKSIARRAGQLGWAM
ncbi:MAG: phosphotransferase [Bacteroidota bacterium]